VRHHTDTVRPWLLGSVITLCWGFGTIAVLHVVSSHNPLQDTLSSYAFAERGAGMLAIAMLSLALGSLLVLGALSAAGVSLTRVTRGLFYAWSGGLTVAAAFPASYERFPNPVSGEIHQYSCLLAFLSLPAIGLSLRRRFPPVARWTWLSTGALLVFGLSYLAGIPALPVGVAQRLALVADLVLLCSLLTLATRRQGVASRYASDIS
jgi:hypothetical protein